MKTFYVQIPCYVAKGRPERSMHADKWLDIPVEADSFNEACTKVQKALTSLVQSAPEPREIEGSPV
jgi:hypothetical protein